MCIIAIKPAGVKLPADDTIKNMFTNNPDGAGFMYAHGGTVNISKGHMKLKDFKKTLSQLKKTIDITAVPMILHFRITTHGGTSAGNTHPFPVTDKLPLLTAERLKTPLAVAHNGTIPIEPLKKDISDTMTYIAEQLAPLYQLKKDFYKQPAGLQLVYNAIRSKMAILDGNGYIATVGDFTDGPDGLKYSNTSYKARTIYYKWDIWDYAIDWHDSAYGRYMTWLSSDDGYIISNGDILDAAYYLSDRDGNLYFYDIDTDMAVPMPGALHNHAGKQINGFKDDCSEYIDIIQSKEVDD